MKSLKEVLLDDLGGVLGILFVIGLFASIAGIPYALVKYTGDPTWYWIYAAEAILFYFLTIIYRMEREF